LAHGRLRHAEFLAKVNHFGDAPSAKVRQAKASELASADQVAQRAHRFFEVFFVVVAVQIEDVEVVGLQARQDGIGLLDQPAS